MTSSAGELEADARETQIEPNIDTIRKLTVLWRSMLEVPDVSLDDDFLYDAGDSVTATKLIVRVRQEIRADVPLMAFFSASTIRAEARLIDTLANPESASSARPF